MFKRILIPVFCTIILAGCGLSDNEAPVPSYLSLQNPVLEANNVPGGNTHKITDVWVYVDGQLQGVFPLPARVPVIPAKATSEVVILAGIRNNGILNSPAFYPFYKSIQKTIELKPLETISIPLIFEYTQDITFDLIADFENSHLLTFDLDSDPNTFLTVTTDDAASGNKSGKIVLPTATDFAEIASTETYLKSSLISGSAYIEMDYKGGAEIGVGLVTYDDINPNGVLTYKVVVVPRENWNKIYIDVTEELSSPRLKSYKLALGFTAPPGSGGVTAFIDNVKLLRY